LTWGWRDLRKHLKRRCDEKWLIFFEKVAQPEKSPLEKIAHET
jgi:hypothetical protein